MWVLISKETSHPEEFLRYLLLLSHHLWSLRSLSLKRTLCTPRSLPETTRFFGSPPTHIRGRPLRQPGPGKDSTSVGKGSFEGYAVAVPRQSQKTSVDVGEISVGLSPQPLKTSTGSHPGTPTRDPDPSSRVAGLNLSTLDIDVRVSWALETGKYVGLGNWGRPR